MWYFVFIFLLIFDRDWESTRTFLTKRQFPGSRIYLFSCFARLDGKCPPHRMLWCAVITLKWWLFWICLKQLIPGLNKGFKENRELLLHGRRLHVPTASRRHQIVHPTRHYQLKRTLHKGNWVFISLSKRHMVCFVPRVSFEHLGSFAAIVISIKRRE